MHEHMGHAGGVPDLLVPSSGACICCMSGITA